MCVWKYVYKIPNKVLFGAGVIHFAGKKNISMLLTFFLKCTYVLRPAGLRVT